MEFISYIYYIISYVALLYFSQIRRSELDRVFGLLLLVYQSTFILKTYQFSYFESLININYDSFSLFFSGTINLIFILIPYVRIVLVSNKHLAIQNDFTKWFIFLAIFSCCVDIYFNFDYFYSLDKATRFSNAVTKIPNLILIDFDWMLIFLAFGIWLFRTGQKFNGVIFVTSISIIGILLGMRYYVVVPALVAYAYYTNTLKFSPKLAAAIVLIITAPLLSTFLEAIKGYFAFYNWLSDYGFLTYLSETVINTPISGEIGAFGTNYFLGMTNELRPPDYISYVAAFIPGSQRFYDFSNQFIFYSQIGLYLNNIDMDAGQGTAFGLILESYYSYGIPLLFWILLRTIYEFPWSDRLRPAVLAILIFISINLIRNGLLISISYIKTLGLISILILIVRRLNGSYSAVSNKST
jgi:hypothetical protein